MITQLGDYKIEARIGEGGFGDVYGAVQTCLDRRVAIKTLRSEWTEDPRQVDGFIAQARMTAKLEHQNIVRIYDCGCRDGLHFIVMQLVDGETLESVLLRKGALGPSVVVRAAFQIADALDHAHKREVVHADLNPGNVIFAEDGTVYITDFGGLCPTGAGERLVGVPEYVSPEQARGGDAGPASDMYSLGVLMYHMLCGKPPFSEEDPRETLNAHISSKVPPIKGPDHKIPPKLSQLVVRLLAKNPEDRPSPEVARDELLVMTSSIRPERIRKPKKVRQPMGPGRKIAAAMIIPVGLGCWMVGAMIFNSLRTENSINAVVKKNAVAVKKQAETEREKRIRVEYAREMTKGKDMYEQGQYGLAEEAFKRASHLDPKSIDPRMFLAAVYIERADYDQASWHLKTVLQMDPDKREARDALRFVRSKIEVSPVELAGP